MNRRKYLLSSIVAVLSISGCNRGGSRLVPPVADEGQRPFFIPDELTGDLVNGRRLFNLVLQKGNSNFLENMSTPTWGINGSFLGPTLRIRNGDAVDISYTNHLDEKTTMHGHGMHVPANMDGGPHQVIAPGETWTSSYTVKQHACTNWYHPHLMGKTAQHVINGLAGLIIIDDDNSEKLDLPRRYGIDDIPVIVQDRSFNSDGTFSYNPSMREIMHGWKGDTLMVNGVINPYLDVEAKQVRFRILNGSNSRVYDFAFVSGKSFKQIATDNAFLESPVDLTRLRLSPGERAEIIVDFSNDMGKEEGFWDANSATSLFKVNIKSAATTTTVLPQQLVDLPKLNPADSVKTRMFILSAQGPGKLVINGESMSMDVINETVSLNDVEIWEVHNTMRMVHNFHIHATHFQLLERNGSMAGVADNEKGFKDTVLIPPNESVKFIVKMNDYKDSANPYMYHCHILEHEDAGMMGQFLVV